MAKWVFLFFVLALAASGWYASQEDAPGWAPALPTLVIGGGVATGFVYAIRWGMRRRKEMAQVAAQLGFEFRQDRRELRNSGIGALKQFAYCRPHESLPFLMRGVATYFANAMTTHAEGAEVILFDCSISRRQGINYQGLFACFHNPEQKLPDLEIVPRLWGKQPEWARTLTEVPPSRAEVVFDHPGFSAEYLVYAAEETAARAVVNSGLLGRLADPLQSGWRIEASGEWCAVTRLVPTGKIGALGDPMEPEIWKTKERYAYHVDYVAVRNVPRFYKEARQFYRSLTGR